MWCNKFIPWDILTWKCEKLIYQRKFWCRNGRNSLPGFNSLFLMNPTPVYSLLPTSKRAKMALVLCQKSDILSFGPTVWSNLHRFQPSSKHGGLQQAGVNSYDFGDKPCPSHLVFMSVLILKPSPILLPSGHNWRVKVVSQSWVIHRHVILHSNN